MFIPKLLILSIFLLNFINTKNIYDKKSYVTPINQINFENQVNKIRQKTKFVSIVHFYRSEGNIIEKLNSNS